MSGRLRRGRLRSPRDTVRRARFAHGRDTAPTWRVCGAVSHVRQFRLWT
jgi:hypothetical protein